jgi:polyhydroxyalkanoate synthesis regulator phasin
MDSATLIATVSVIVGAFVGAVAGRLNALQGLAAINQLLESTIDSLKQDKNTMEESMSRMSVKIDALEGIVTQRAEIAQLHTKVDSITARIEAIASKVGA